MKQFFLIVLSCLMLGQAGAYAQALDWKTCTPYCIRDISENTANLYSAANQKKIPLSIISFSTAKAIWNAQKKDPSLPYDYLPDGAPGRTYILGKNLASSGLETGMAWVSGNVRIQSEEFGNLRLSYHVATVVLVRQDKTVSLYVIEPGLTEEPVSYEKWKKLMGGNPKLEGFTNRYVFYPEDFLKNLGDYDRGSLSVAEQMNTNSRSRLAYFRKNQAVLAEYGLKNTINDTCHAQDYVRDLIKKNDSIKADLAGKSKEALLEIIKSIEKNYANDFDLRTSAAMLLTFSGRGPSSSEPVHGLLMAVERKKYRQKIDDIEDSGNLCADYVIGLYFLIEKYKSDGNDFSLPAEWLRESGDSGFQPAQEQIFQIYNSVAESSSTISLNDYKSEETFQKYSKVAENREADALEKLAAMTNMGMMHQYGIGTQRDIKKAVEWYQKAVDSGDGRAMAYLGRIYEFDGGGVIPEDRKKALDLYKRAMEAGNGHGTQNYALLMYRDSNKPEDAAALTRLLELAVRQGFPQAAIRLGDRYIKGVGAPKSPEKARALYRILSRDWYNPDVQAAYISVLLQGVGGAVDRETAKQVYEDCRNHTHSKACNEAWAKAN